MASGLFLGPNRLLRAMMLRVEMTVTKHALAFNKPGVADYSKTFVVLSRLGWVAVWMVDVDLGTFVQSDGRFQNGRRIVPSVFLS